MNYIIYCLKDPFTLQVVYVGQTSQTIENRLSGHMAEQRASKKKDWIDSLKANKKTPLISIIENTDSSSASEREKFWINYYYSIGAKLLNENEYNKIVNADRMKPILEWLSNHDLIVINRLEKKVGIPQRVLKKVIDEQDGRALPEVYYEPLIRELEKYGLFDAQ